MLRIALGVGSWSWGGEKTTGLGWCLGRAKCTAKTARRKSRNGKGEVWGEGWVDAYDKLGIVSHVRGPSTTFRGLSSFCVLSPSHLPSFFDPQWSEKKTGGAEQEGSKGMEVKRGMGATAGACAKSSIRSWDL